jgi:hypothetical protein
MSVINNLGNENAVPAGSNEDLKPYSSQGWSSGCGNPEGPQLTENARALWRRSIVRARFISRMRKL